MTLYSEQDQAVDQQSEPLILPPNPNFAYEYNPESLRHIVVAGGNFWGVEAFMARIPGVAATEVGYANGIGKKADWASVVHGELGFTLAVRVSYDPRLISLGRLIDLFFTIIDPTKLNHQGFDFGPAYRTGVYYSDIEDYREIEEAFNRLRKRCPERIMVEFEPLKNYIKAEPSQQDYLEKNPDAYCSISFETLPQYNKERIHEQTREGFDESESEPE